VFSLQVESRFHNGASTNVRAQLDFLLRQALAAVTAGHGPFEPGDLDPQIERTRDARHGDFTSNVALRLAQKLSLRPRELAGDIIAALPASPLIADTDVAGAGFINFNLVPEAYHEEVRVILEDGPSYGCSELGAGQRIIVEYVSANPTGPLHVGHGRHAAYGATLASLLRTTGHEVHEEYYVNDAGRQMEILAASVWLRYAQQLGHELPFPGNCYQGTYVIEIADELRREHGEKLNGDITALRQVFENASIESEKRLDMTIAEIKSILGEPGFRIVFDAALDSVLADIKNDLEEFGVVPQNWYSERSLVDGGAITQTLEILESNGMLYTQEGAKWFRASDLGDEKDRVVVRENGVTTYFASDIAYHFEKRERGFTHLLDVLGADHHGYIARVRAGLEAMGADPLLLEVRLVQFVTLYRGSQKMQMSTRSGEYVTLRQLREEVGNDAARFFYVSRSNDQHLDFDLELAKSQSNDNPVYYIQYAHARVASMLKRMEAEGLVFARPQSVNLARLTEPEEHALMVALSRFPEQLHLAAVNRAPQQIAHYLRDTAAGFHACYNAHRVLVEDVELRDARVALALAAQQVIRNGLTLLGVAAPDNM
jgi:arginyl-tRNA synthetase